jgi:integrase
MAGLTPITIEKAKPRKNKTGEAVRTELPDAGCKGLYLVIQPSGAKGWAVRFRIGSKPRKLTLEPDPGAPPLTLAAARRLAADALHQVEQGVDPAKQKRNKIEASHDAAATRAADTVEAMAVQFIERYAKVKNRSWAQVEATFAREVLPRWRGRSVHDITKDDVEDLIDGIVARGHPIAANRALSALRRFFGWMGGRSKGGRKADMRSRLRTTPCLGIEAPGTEKSRERFLTDAEIVTLWQACDEEGEPHGLLVKLLLLTGQRRGEVAGTRRDELDMDKRLWSLPGSRTKNGKPHVVPLSDQAMSIIKAVTPIGRDFVFTFSGEAPIGVFSDVKRRLDKRMKLATPWVMHDLRRTCATGMADVGIQPHIIEAVLNHSSGYRAGVAGVYNRSPYAAEKADALQRWADHVEQLVTGKPVRDVPIRSRAAGDATARQ